MSTPETKARAGEVVSPAEAVKSALSGFMNDFTAFQADMNSKLTKQEERLTMLDRKSLNRPALSSAPVEAPHQKAFNAYLRTGDDDGLRGLEIEGKSMSTLVNGDG